MVQRNCSRACDSILVLIPINVHGMVHALVFRAEIFSCSAAPTTTTRLHNELELSFSTKGPPPNFITHRNEITESSRSTSSHFVKAGIKRLQDRKKTGTGPKSAPRKNKTANKRESTSRRTQALRTGIRD